MQVVTTSGSIVSGSCSNSFHLQDRVIRYGIGWNGDGGVFYWQSVNAEYFTPMDLRAFPFDYQNLLVEMQVPVSREGWSGSLVHLRPSMTGNHLFVPQFGGKQRAEAQVFSFWTVDRDSIWLKFTMTTLRDV